jgi:hypothetical protein
MNRAIANILALATKLGIGSSTPTANTVLRGTGAGTSAYGQIVSGDITDGTIVNADVNASAGILLSKLEGGTSGLLKSNGTVITSGNTIGSADIADDSITNADVNSAAAIAVTKLAHVGAGNVLRSNGTANVGGKVANGDIAADTIDADRLLAGSMDYTEFQRIAPVESVHVNRIQHLGANNVLRSNGTTNVTGQVVNGDIQNATIDASSKLADGSVTTVKITPNNVTQAFFQNTGGAASSGVTGAWAGTGNNLSLTGLTVGSKVVFWYTATAHHSTASGALQVGLGLDTASGPVASTYVSAPVAGYYTTLAFVGQFTTTATSHSLMETIYVGTATFTRAANPCLMAVELKR